MQKATFGSILVLGALGCAAPQREGVPASTDLDPLRKEIAELRKEVGHLQNQVGHLQSEVSAASAENELTEMTIDSVSWSDERLGIVEDGATPILLCHVQEWRGFGKMLRFTRHADSAFVLEAQGEPAINAYMDTGAICNSDGSIRYVVLRLGGELAPSTTHRLRPRNENEKYRWSVPADVFVMGSKGAR